MMQSGQYKDYSDVVSSALENLVVLQKELSDKGVLIIDSSNEPASSRLQPESKRMPEPGKKMRPSNKRTSKATVSKSEALPTPDVPTRIPDIFKLVGIDDPPSLANPPGDVWTVRQEVPLERWIFGQYNKLLPTKASCRALCHLLAGESKGVRLGYAASKIAEEALTLGSFLAHHDKENGTKRDSALSIAFPSSDRDAEKSRIRYANQFVAGASKQGQVSGLLIDLKLINHTGEKDPRLKLTEAGWNFIKLWNPVLDGDTPGTTQKFTTEERSFLLDHISSSVPAEDFAYRTILTAVNEGARTPRQLDTVLGKYVSHNADQSLTRSFLASQRSGAVSRMADLELITRERDGVKVAYVVTDLGTRYAQDKVVPLQRRKHLE